MHPSNHSSPPALPRTPRVTCPWTPRPSTLAAPPYPPRELSSTSPTLNHQITAQRPNRQSPSLRPPSLPSIPEIPSLPRPLRSFFTHTMSRPPSLNTLISYPSNHDPDPHLFPLSSFHRSRHFPHSSSSITQQTSLRLSPTFYFHFHLHLLLHLHLSSHLGDS